MGTSLTQTDYEQAAQALKCSVAAVQAIVHVEAPKGGFDQHGRLTILFERHWFHRYTQGKFASQPDISNSQRGGYTKNEWARFTRAARLDELAAQLSTSWGKPQIMGFNFAVAGYRTVAEMIVDFNTGEAAQLHAFVRLIQSPNFDLADELQRVSVAKSKVARLAEWHRIARSYNGARYAENDYHNKLEAAFMQFASSAQRKEQA